MILMWSKASAGPLSWKERDRVRCVTSPGMDHTSPQPSPYRRGGRAAVAVQVSDVTIGMGGYA